VTDRPPLRSYRPGPWFGILGTHATVLLPPSEKDRVTALWELVDTGAGFDEVLDALIAGGLRELPGFVLVSEAAAGSTREAGTVTKVVVRGAARARFTTADGEVFLEGDESTTWVERSLTGVVASVLEVAGAADGPEVPVELRVDAGLVRVSRVEEPAEVVAPARSPEPEPVAAPDPEPEPAPAPVEEHDTADQPAVRSGPGDHDGLTQAGGWSPGPPAPPGIPGQEPAPAVTRPVARLLFSTGESVEVDRAVVVGRAPEARRFPLEEQPQLLTVPSPQQEISSTHLEIRPGSGADHGSAVVTDLGSTNGTVLVQPGLAPEDLQPGVPVALLPGAVIDLGDGLTISVVVP
jgi:hypothetical protein